MEVRVPWPIRALVVLASVATPLAAMAAAIVAARALRLDGRVDWPWMIGPPAAIVLALWLVLRRPSPVPRSVRASCVLVLVHACLIGGICVVWARAASTIKLAELLPLSDEIPVEQAGALIAVVLLAAALVSISSTRRRGVPRWLGPTVHFLLAHLLALGIIAPIVAAARQGHWYFERAPEALAILLLTGSLAAISVIAARFKYAADINRVFAGVVAVAIVIAIGLAAVMNNDARWAYSNFGPLIIGNVFLALVAINLLGAFHWLALRPLTGEAQTATTHVGTVVTDDGLGRASWVRSHGWMEGLRIESRPFHVRSSSGHLEVPGQAKVVLPLPLSSIHLADGQTIPVLNDGDCVHATGYVDPPSDGPFRQSTLPIPGRNGIVVTARDDATSARQNAVLAVWRPCCMYLAVVTLIALPAVVASLSYDEPVSVLLNGFARTDVCGNPGQHCCGGEFGSCHSGAHCKSQGMCAACGALGQECCGRGFCGGDLHCDGGSNTCAAGADVGSSFHYEHGEAIDAQADEPGEQLLPSEIRRGMLKIKPKVKACYERFRTPAMVNVTMTIQPDGRVSSAWATGKFAGTDTGHCVERAVETAKLPHFNGRAMTGIDYPFMLGK